MWKADDGLRFAIVRFFASNSKCERVNIVMTKKKCWIYLYSSTEEGSRIQLEKQLGEAKAYAEKNDYVIVGISHDIGGGSRCARRPELSKRMEAGLRREFDVLLVGALSRISRDVQETFNLMQYFHSCGIAVESAAEDTNLWGQAITTKNALMEQVENDPWIKKNRTYIEAVNEILAEVDFSKLDESCNGSHSDYAKNVLVRMHNELVKVYGTDVFDEWNCELIDAPAVIRSHNTGRTAIGLVTIDLESSGEHYGTAIFTELGVLQQGARTLTEEEKTYLKKNFVPYDYWYTPIVEGDIHVTKYNMPDCVRCLIDACYEQDHGGAVEEVEMT